MNSPAIKIMSNNKNINFLNTQWMSQGYNSNSKILTKDKVGIDGVIKNKRHGSNLSVAELKPSNEYVQLLWDIKAEYLYRNRYSQNMSIDGRIGNENSRIKQNMSFVNSSNSSFAKSRQGNISTEKNTFSEK